jgi:hypothetical protein
VATGTGQCSSDSENLPAVRVAQQSGRVGEYERTGFRTFDARPGDDPHDTMGSQSSPGRAETGRSVS